MAVVPVYYEGSWAILSTIGLVNTLNGLIVVGIVGKSPIAAVPIVVSAAAAIANGLCYYAFYADYSLTHTVVAAAFADVFWLIQEAGLSVYSYIILSRVLHGRARMIFFGLFWVTMAIIVALRIAILISRARDLLHDDDNLARLVSRLHTGYFTLIAIVEIISAYFLLRKFAAAKKRMEVLGWSRFPSYLTQSTELRLATLAIIGTTRAITYSFQRAQKATTVTGQVDRFVYTLECLFPMIMYIDMLASRVVGSEQNASISEGDPQGASNKMLSDPSNYMKSSMPTLAPIFQERIDGDDMEISKCQMHSMDVEMNLHRMRSSRPNMANRRYSIY